MAKKPLLIFPRPTSEKKSSKSSVPGKVHFPSKGQQIGRLEGKVSELDRVLANQAAYLGQNPANLVSEMILVLEVVGQLDDFFKAVALTPGMEFLGEAEAEFDPDDQFYSLDSRGNRQDKKIGARLFLTMANQQALRELQGYWNEYKKQASQQTFQRGTTKFRDLFKQLKDIRPYSVQDRLKDTGIEDYLEELRQSHSGDVKFEVELAYKVNSEENIRAYQEVTQLLQANNGSVIEESRTIIPEIGYHAFIANAPITAFDDLSENTNISFLKSQQVLFFRPVGQSIFRLSEESVETELGIALPDLVIQGDPVVALLDGLPLQNHTLLSNRLRVDDPDDFGRNYIAEKRQHGTSMASLILNGDLNHPNREPLNRPIYVRPIMKPSANGFQDGEFLPDDRLPIDLIHRAVARMFDGEEGGDPAAPRVKIINFSIGDPHRPFQSSMSTWAKLIDWLSHKYNVLFIISAGNKIDQVELDIPRDEFDSATPDAIQRAMLKKIIEGNFDRKILSPAESINSLTVGSSHHDVSADNFYPNRKNLLACSHLLSPVSRIGFGFNKSVKPEILMPGGRKLFRKAPIQHDPLRTVLNLETMPISSLPPGNLVAIPGPSGNNSAMGYSCGTSNATALTTHLAARLYEMLLVLNAELDEDKRINDRFFTVVIKSLLVHGASWGEAKDHLENMIRSVSRVVPRSIKKHLFPYIGYGCVDAEKILFCTDHKVTLIGYGDLTINDSSNAHVYSFPLPPSIGQRQIEKKLAITLAWISPLNFKTNKYRKAQLFFDNLDNNGHLTLERQVYDYKAAQKGTLQHDILTGNYADAFIDGDVLNIKINCRQDASGLSKHDAIPYGLAVTMEIQENVETQIYEEVRSRLQQRIRSMA